MLPKAILFDLDDTLVSFDAHVKPSWQKICEKYAPKTGLGAQALYAVIRKHSAWYWSDPVRHREGRLVLEETRRRLVSEALTLAGIDDKALAIRLADEYSALQESLISLFPDTIPTLDFLKRQGIKMALVTNGNAAMQRRKIERFSLENYFLGCFVEGELGFGKPDPRVFSLALQALEETPHDTWCVGDNLVWDVRGAQEAGIHAVWKDTYKKGLGDSPVRPDRIIASLEELVNSDL